MAWPVAGLMVAGVAGLGLWHRVSPAALAPAIVAGAAAVVAVLTRSRGSQVLRLTGPDAWLRDGSQAPVLVACESGWLLGGRLAGLVVRRSDGRAAVLYVHRARCPDMAWRRFCVWLKAG